MTGLRKIDIRSVGTTLLFGLAFTGMLALAGAGQAAERNMTDQAIADAVENEFAYDAAVRPDRIDVTVREGIVTLNGVTGNLLEKERAARLAETVKGVRAVVDNISVHASRRKTAEALQADVIEALSIDPAADSYEIAVDADAEGRVTLSGNVDSFQERELAATVAKGVAGVTGVDNKLTVDYVERNRADSEIKDEIQQRLYWDALVDSSLVNVKVDNNQAILSGGVGSMIERSRARYLAYVDGVRAVDVSGLEIQNWARDPKRRDPEYVTKSDEEVAKAVKDALLYDPRVKLFDVDVAVSSGTTTLRGEVDNLAAKRSAGVDARNTVGVDQVDNRIKVRPSMKDADNELNKRVSAALDRDPYLEKYEVSVVATGGIVKLYGTVDSFFEKSRAEYVTEHVNGVIGVDNNLAVNNDHTAMVYDPYVSYYPPYLYGWYDYDPIMSHRADLAIKEAINDELWWSPFVDANEVTVTVVDGKATLTGAVDSLAEWHAASENAWEGGAIWVTNNLEIDQGDT